MGRFDDAKNLRGGVSISRRGLFAGLAVLAGLGLSGIATFATDVAEDHGNGAAGQYHWGDWYNHCLYNGNGFGCASNWLQWNAFDNQALRVAFAVEMYSNYTNPLYEYCRCQAYSQCGDTNYVNDHRLWFARVEDNYLEYYWNGAFWRRDPNAFAWTNEFLGPGYGTHNTLMHTYGYPGFGWIERKASDFQSRTLGAYLGIFNVTHYYDKAFEDVYPGVKFDPNNAEHRKWVQYSMNTAGDCGGDLTVWLDKILIRNRYDLFGAIVTLKNRYSGSYLTVPKGGSSEWERVAQQAKGDESTCGCFAVGIGANDDAFGDFLHRLHPVSSKGWKSALYGESGRTILNLSADSTNYPTIDSGASNAYYEKLWTWNAPNSSRYLDFWITDDLQSTPGYSQLICDETGLSLSLTRNTKSDGADVCLWCDGKWKGTYGVQSCDWEIEESVFRGDVKFAKYTDGDASISIIDPAKSTKPSDTVGTGSVRYLSRFVVCQSGNESAPGEKRLLGGASQEPWGTDWYKEAYANRCVGFPHALSNIMRGFYLKTEDGTGSICYRVKETDDSDWSDVYRDGAWTDHSSGHKVGLAKIWLEGDLADGYDLSLRACTSKSGWGERIFSFRASEDNAPVLGIAGESIVSMQASLIPRPTGCLGMLRDFAASSKVDITEDASGFIYSQTVMAIAGKPGGIHQMADMFRGVVTCSAPLLLPVAMARVRYHADGIDDDSVVFTDKVKPGRYDVNDAATRAALKDVCNLNDHFGEDSATGFIGWSTDKELTKPFSSKDLKAGDTLDLYARNRLTVRIDYTADSIKPEAGGTYRTRPDDAASDARENMDLLDFSSVEERHVLDGITLPNSGDDGVGHKCLYWGERLAPAKPREVFTKQLDGTWRRYQAECWFTDASGNGTPVSAITAKRDATIYIKWVVANAEGVEGRRG